MHYSELSFVKALSALCGKKPDFPTRVQEDQLDTIPAVLLFLGGEKTVANSYTEEEKRLLKFAVQFYRAELDIFCVSNQYGAGEISLEDARREIARIWSGVPLEDNEPVEDFGWV